MKRKPEGTRSRSLCAFLLLCSVFIVPPAWCGTLVKLPATGSQPTVITPQGKVNPLYKDSYAILISESRYLGAANNGWRPLENTHREVDDLAQVLRRHGFNIWRVSDASGDELRSFLRDFIAEYGQETDNRLFFFFSGHGYTNERNDFSYLVPVDAKDPNVYFSKFLRAALPIADIELLAKEVESRHALFVFDSCFSGTIFTSKSIARTPLARGDESSARWRFLTGSSAKAVRQFISAGGPKETLPAKSVFLPLLLQALDGEASSSKDGYVTGKEVGYWLEQQVPTFNSKQNPQSSMIRVPELAFGDMVFQYESDRDKKYEKDKKFPIQFPTAQTGTEIEMSSGPIVLPPLQTSSVKGHASDSFELSPAQTSLTYSLDLLFDFDKAVPNAKAKTQLEEMVIGMKGAALERIDVLGLADQSEQQTMAYAARVAMKRADSVKDFLVAKGIPAKLIYTQSRVADPARSPAERTQQRLVKINVVGKNIKSR